MKYFIIILFLLFTYCSYGQNSCNCPKDRSSSLSEPDTIFHFSSGEMIGLCGYRGTDSVTKNISFYEFTLFVCGQDSAITYGGWFLQHSRLTKVKDTLILEDCPTLPIGDNFSETKIPWTTEKFYFINGKVRLEHSINRNIRKYSSKETQSVLNEYERIKPSHSNLNDTTLKLAYKLFIATISGNKVARKYFIDIPHKFNGLDAIYAEIYNDIQDKLSDWDKNNIR